MNEAQLSNGARSLFIYGVDNDTFSSGLDIHLKKRLLLRLSQHKGLIAKSANQADLIIWVTATSSTYSKASFSYFGTAYYKYVYSASARVNVKDTRKGKKSYTFLSSASFTFQYSKADLDLSDDEWGRKRATEKLGEKIYQTLIQQF